MSTYRTRLDRIEQEMAPPATRIVWMEIGETAERAIAKAAGKAGMSVGALRASANLLLVGWGKEAGHA